MNDIIFTLLFVSVFLRFFNSKEVLNFRKPVVGLSLAGHGVLEENSGSDDHAEYLKRDLLKADSKKKPVEGASKRYSSSYGNKYEYVKYILAEKINDMIVYKKRYVDPKFRLIDCANEVGCNRSYVSRAINESYNQNFNSMINDHRYELLCKVVKESPLLTREEYALRSGFNSVTTMMRIIKLKTGMSYKEWKKTVLWRRQ